jgi:membrane-bound lytic murein transglycosylase B
MKRKLVLVLCLIPFCVALTPVVADSTDLATEEENRKSELQNRLCADKELNCAYVIKLFADPRLIVYTPPATTAPPSKDRERNPYLTKRFGLLSPESLERCRGFVQAHLLAFDAAYKIYGVPKEIICGHLRIETDFGIPTGLSPHPLGAVPAINRLVTLYVRRPSRPQTGSQFARRQAFALNQMKFLLQAASDNGWDLFQVPGSPTGAIGLAQFEPSSFKVAVDGDGDGKIDLFNPEDAILSVAHYLTTRGWDSQPQHQYRAIYAYYGGHYDTDPDKYYMRAVLRYAQEMISYLRSHPIETGIASLPQSLPRAERTASGLERIEQPED